MNLLQRMRERFDELSGRLARGYADVPVTDGLAEIAAAVTAIRRL